MHGVKRLFAWMIPRFDRDRFRVSLVSLRQEGSLRGDARLARHRHHVSREVEVRSDDAAGPAAGRSIGSGSTSLHLHGYGATTFGRLAGGDAAACPSSLHEHANLTSTPWFQKVADRLLEPLHRHRDRGLAKHRRVRDAARGSIRPERVKVVYLGAPLDEFSRAAAGRGDGRDARANSGRRLATSSSATSRACTTRKGTHTCSAAANWSSNSAVVLGSTLFGEGPLRPALEAQAAALGLGDRFVFGGFVERRRPRPRGVRHRVFPSLWEGTPLTVFETLAAGKPIVATDADGLMDVLTDGRDALHRRRSGRGARWPIASARADRRPGAGLHTRRAARARRPATMTSRRSSRRWTRLYRILATESRATRREHRTRAANLSFLTERATS